MPKIDVSEFDGSVMLENYFDALLQRLDTLNRTLSNIDESLRGIEYRLSKATGLDNND